MISVDHEKVPVFVSVIILNYNGYHYLRRLFSSLNEQSFSAFEIIFVDNASSDGSLDLVNELSKTLREGLSIQILAEKVNFGYCQGNNIGASMVSDESKYLVFLNNDTYVDAFWLERLVNAAELSNNVGFVGSRIADMDGSSFSTIAFDCDFYGQSERVLLVTDEKRDDGFSFNFFYCSGASLLVSKKVFLTVGGFDGSLFMYHDELDLCWRIRMCGYEPLVVSSSVCYHVRRSEHGLDLPVWKYYHGIVKNRLRVLLKNYDSFSLLKYFPFVMALIVTRGFLSCFVNRNVRYLSALVKGFVWNVVNFRSTLVKRYEIQQRRTVKDKEILSVMVPHSLEIEYLKRFLNRS